MNKTLKFKGEDLYIKMTTYSNNGNLALLTYIKDNDYDDLYCDITINLYNYFTQPDEGYIDDLCKTSGLEDALLKEGIIEKIIRKNVKYNMGKYDLVKFNLEKLKEYDIEGYRNFMSGYEKKDLSKI